MIEIEQFFRGCEACVMVRSASRAPGLGGRIAVKKAVGPEETAAWVSVVSKAFLGRPGRDPAALEIGGVPSRMKNVRRYLALADGEPVGGAALSVVGGVAILFCDGTAVSWRGQGSP